MAKHDDDINEVFDGNLEIVWIKKGRPLQDRKAQKILDKITTIKNGRGNGNSQAKANKLRQEIVKLLDDLPNWTAELLIPDGKDTGDFLSSGKANKNGHTRIKKRNGFNNGAILCLKSFEDNAEADLDSI